MNEPIIHIQKLYKKYREADDFSVNDLSLIVEKKKSSDY